MKFTSEDLMKAISLQGDIRYRLNKSDSVDLRKILEKDLLNNDN